MAIARNVAGATSAQQTNQSGADADFGGFMSDLSDYVGVQLTASRRDMGQAEALLEDAIKRLLSCLPSKAGLAAVAGGGTPADSSARLAQAIVNMQFQDLVSQLLRRADERLAGLDKLLQELASILAEHDTSALRSAAQCLGSQTLAPERRTNSSIQQLNMAPGDVELF
jgi:hypothetical protein